MFNPTIPSASDISFFLVSMKQRPVTDLFSRPNLPKYRKSAPFVAKGYGSDGEEVTISLSVTEKDKMKELQIVAEKLELKIEGLTLETPYTSDIYSLIYLAARKLIDSMSRVISSFEELPHADRIILLKGSITEMIFLWSLRSLDPDKKAWVLPCFEVS